MSDWDEFTRRLQESDAARLYPGSRLVIGRGSHSPRVVFIGEAPGAEEDAQGLPFVGRSGQLLDEWIEWLGLSEEDYYITNVVKVRPPGNRDPTREEVDASAPWLSEQLALLDPRWIICVGRFAMNHVYPRKKGILKESGKVIDGRYYITPHPSYFLRRGGTGWKPYLQGLKDALEGKRPLETQRRLL